MGGGLEFDLSHGAVATMWRSPGSTLRPVMQVADARHVPDGSGLSPAREQRYRIDLSDGVHSQPGTLAASLNRLVSDGALRRGSVVRVLDFGCDYRRKTITVQLQILQTECSLIGSLKPYEPTRKSAEFTTRSLRYALRPDREPSFRGQHIHQSCIASDVGISANGLSYHGASRGSSLPGGRIGDFSGRSVVTIGTTQLKVNPDMPMAERLKQWYMAGGKTAPCVSLSQDTSNISRVYVQKTISQIKDENLGRLDKPDFITVSAVISHVVADNFCYPACTLELNGKRCNKKVTRNDDWTWYCGRCNQSFENCEYRYLLMCQIMDHTGTASATAFQEAGEAIVGYTAHELFIIRNVDQDEERFRQIMDAVVWRKFLFKLTIKEEIFYKEYRVKLNIDGVEKLDASDVSHHLLEEIDNLLKDVSHSAKPAVWKTVQQIKDEYLGYLDEPDFITVKAFFSFVHVERLCSAACPLAVNGKRCNVKATGNGDGTWHCKLCRQSYGSCDYGIWYCKRCGHSFDSCDYGYLVRIQIMDDTNITPATLCEEAAKEIFGCTAKNLYLMEGNEHDYNQLGDIIQVAACKQYVLQLKVEAKPFSNGRTVECVVLKAEKVNPSTESHRLLGAMNTHLWDGLDPFVKWSRPTYSDLSGFMGRSTARSSNKSHAASPGCAKWSCSADRYGQHVNGYAVKPSALPDPAFGDCGCPDIDVQRSSAPDGFMGKFYGASPTAANFAPDVRSIYSTRTSAHRAERSPKKP